MKQGTIGMEREDAKARGMMACGQFTADKITPGGSHHFKQKKPDVVKYSKQTRAAIK